MLDTVFNELFKTREKLYNLKERLKKLEQMSCKRCTADLKSRIDSTLDEIEHFRVRMFILEKLCNKKI